MATTETRDDLHNLAPRAKALRMLRQWIEEGVWQPGEALPAERDIAIRIGIGPATVQRALRVLEADGLIVKHEGRTRTVAQPRNDEKGLMHTSVLVVGAGDWVDAPPDVQPFGWGGYVALGALRALSQAGLHAMVIPPQNLDRAALERLLASEPMGFVVPEIDIPNLDPSPWVNLAREMKVPSVVFGDEPWCEGFDRAVPDHETGAYDLARWLLARGRRHIRQYWTLTPGSCAWAIARQRGYERAMREAGLEPLEPVVSLDATYAVNEGAAAFLARSQAAAGALLPFALGSQKTDALMVVTDGSVASVVSALRMLGKTPNADIEIVGYDNYWDQTYQRALEPVGPLATIDKNNIEAGRLLTELLLARRAGTLPPEPQVRLVKPQLRVLPTA